MAKITYGDELPVDSVGKKFQGVVTDTGSANEIAGIKGVNRVTQQGKTVADMSVAVATTSGAGAAIGTTSDAAVTTNTTGTQVGFLRGLVTWMTRLGYVDGATFTRGASYVLPGLAGIYESTVSTLTAGKVALARLTSRGAVVTAGDRYNVTMYSAMPTNTSTNFVSFASANIQNAKSARIWIANTTDAAVTISIFLYSTFSASVVYQESISAGQYRMIGPGAVSATGGSGSYKQCDALGYLLQSATVGYAAATTPTTGTLTIIAMVEA